jgi:hypothetical protein
VFDWRSSLLGNRSRNSSMDTLTTPVLLRYMVTNSRRARVFIVAGSVKEGKTIHRVSPRPSAFGVSQSSSVSRRSETSVQCSSNSRIQEATSDKVFTIIVICASSCKSPELINPVTNPNPRTVISHTTHP